MKNSIVFMLVLFAGTSLQANQAPSVASKIGAAALSKAGQFRDSIITYSQKAFTAGKTNVMQAYEQVTDKIADSEVVQSALVKAISAKSELMGALLKHPVGATFGALTGLIVAYELFAPDTQRYEYQDNGGLRRINDAKRMSYISGFARATLALVTIAGGAIAGSYLVEVADKVAAR